MRRPILESLEEVLRTLHAFDIHVQNMTIKHEKFILLQKEMGDGAPVVIVPTVGGITCIEDESSHRNVTVVS